ncbi:hypothetical protein ACWCWD_11795 [Streptomyces sp. NPDC001493]
MNVQSLLRAAMLAPQGLQNATGPDRRSWKTPETKIRRTTSTVRKGTP